MYDNNISQSIVFYMKAQPIYKNFVFNVNNVRETAKLL